MGEFSSLDRREVTETFAFFHLLVPLPIRNCQDAAARLPLLRHALLEGGGFPPRAPLGKGGVRGQDHQGLQHLEASGVSPFGQAPVLEVDGKPIAQTGAIARYCGKLSGHYPKDDDFAAAKIDEILDTATDMTTTMGT